jgi:hypothetical protein
MGRQTASIIIGCDIFATSKDYFLPLAFVYCKRWVSLYKQYKYRLPIPLVEPEASAAVRGRELHDLDRQGKRRRLTVPGARAAQWSEK